MYQNSARLQKNQYYLVFWQKVHNISTGRAGVIYLS